MKTLTYLIIQSFIILFSHNLQAQDFTKIDIPNNNVLTISSLNKLPLSSYQYREKDPVKKYRKMKTGGIGLTSVGTAATIVGGLLIKKDSDLRNANPNRKDRSMNYGFGIALISVGVPGILSGVPMWIIGERKLKKALNNVSIQATTSSAGLVYRF